ncbi:MAG: DNA mismatch repair endonuclease MutL [Desulfobacula sp.]|uniref:DNA mismatch repair endonuclease MutL n=1 Tax=Desulfobacula sp. TaxID=2593537 RepID=UPI0025C0A15E|nr:DNA mismatch repair endonuclease MutL [Desulfobacula sp.]MCD4719001.1 DNA mismatch repair endonuclease MutL [Desulfobacula sp.]
MTTIRILPEILSNQIAAGEVVQRPSSVIKELVENSIDAKATSITIEAVKGGKSLIRVSDNGIGLSKDDALLSIERYATSKIFTKEDLFSISTMGFRGEALPSIASVSKFSLVTRTKDTDIGTKIDIIGGKIQNVSDAGAPTGTMVEVKNLFFNTPARKKFLKSDNTEISHVADAISGMALGNSHIQFRLFLNNKLQKSFSSSDDLFQRSVRILGRDVADRLYKLEFSDEFIHIHGYCSNPSVTRRTSSKIFLFVNNRLVYDRGLISAIFQGYKGRIMKSNFPLGVFFIDIAFDQVDVNVHPSKKEIKFFNGQRVYQAVSKTIGNALSREQQNIAAYSKAQIISDAAAKKTIEKFEYLDKAFKPQQMDKVEQSSMDWQKNFVQEQTSQKIPSDFTYNDSKLTCDLKVKTQNSRVTLKLKFKVIGQIMGTYILAEAKDGLMLIDQHAAHERIVYEKLKQRYHSLKAQTQNLAVPETLELNFKEADLLSNILEDLKTLGMIIEPFGDTTFVVKAVPAIIDEKEIKPIIIEILETALIKKDRFSKEDWLEKCLILMACHGAIRANLNLSQIEIEKLLADLEQCENPRHCPHGRPIMISWTKRQIEKLFKRVL